MGQNEDRNMAMVCHLLGLIGFLGPLIIWLIKKDQSAVINEHGKKALNFQLSILLYSFISGLLVVVIIGVFLIWAVVIFNLVMIIIASIKANKGEEVKYPLCIQFIK